MPPLDGLRVGLLEARKQKELAALVARQGGEPVCAAAVREAAVHADIEPLLDRLVSGRYDCLVLLTAVAFTALCDEADRRGLLPAVREACGRLTLASRGPKPQLALKRQALGASVITRAPHTSVELLAALEATPLAGARVLLLHYGERNDQIRAALLARGAVVDDVCLYEWQLPDDVAPLEEMVRAIVGLSIDALAVTSQVQCRHLLEIADRLGVRNEALAALQRHVVVAAIGPVCGAAMRKAGIVPDVIPELPNSPALVRALADYFSLTRELKEESL